MSLTRGVWEQAVLAASRAPSPHNAQPARWRLRDDQVELFEDPTGWLSAADPAGRDSQISLGMAWEAMTAALSLSGIRLGQPKIVPNPYPPPAAAPRTVARATVAGGGTMDILAVHQDTRRCWRGNFRAAEATELTALTECVSRHSQVAMPIPDAMRESLAKWYEGATLAGLGDAGTARELYQWMRFSTRSPAWFRDGLSAECLGLGPLEARCAALLMQPSVIRVVVRLGLGHLLISEATKIRSATMAVTIRAPLGQPPFETGRRWYRFWLAVTAAGFAGVPMSALADSDTHRAALLAQAPVGPGYALVNIMRLGPMPSPPPPRSARRPVADLLMD